MRSSGPHLLFLTLFCWSLSSLSVTTEKVTDKTIEKVVEKSLALNLARDRQWLKLLHYEPGFWGTKKSQIDGPDFFLHPDGMKDPKAELIATIKAFWSVQPGTTEALNPQCKYPARYLYLKKKLGSYINYWPDQNCERFQKYFTALRGISVSLVFSSYYLNNPSSSFGHTFLRINKAPMKDGRRHELLDYGVNYAAAVDSSNALVYAFRGMFGMFRGSFTSVPYYYKVREYNNSESRDLWEYELNVSPEAVDMLIAHIWELGPTWIDYWYLTENCSYHMFTILEAADPSISLTENTKKYVIPSDTVKTVWNTPGLVKSFQFRPSIRTEFFARVKTLATSEREELIRIVENQEFSSRYEAMRPDQKRRILDAAVDYYDYKFSAQTQKKDSVETKLKNAVLSKRSEINLLTQPLKLNPNPLDMPHLGHGSRKIGLGFEGTKDSADLYHFQYKYALHDQLDPVLGYPEYAHITFWDVQASYHTLAKKIELEDWTLVEVISTSPVRDFAKSMSWRLKVGIERVRNENCDFCHFGGISGGGGYTFQMSEVPNFSSYLGLRGALMYSNDYSKKLYYGVGPNIRLRARWSEKLTALLETWVRIDPAAETQWYQEVTLSGQMMIGKDWGFRATAKDLGFDKSARIDWVLYH